MPTLRLLAPLAALLLGMPQATSAATLTVDIPNCSQVALSGSGGSYTITCTAAMLTCVAQSSPASPNAGQVATLTVSCNPAATAATWQASRDCTTPTSTGVNTATVSEAHGGGRSCVYTANASAGANSGSASANVVWLGTGTTPPPPPANAPTGCSISRTPANGSVPTGGGAVSMSAACTGGGAVTSYTWRKGATSGWASGATANDTLPANTGAAAVVHTYGVTACAGAACAAEVVTTFSVAGGTPVGFCAGQDVVTGDLIWGDRVTTADNGHIVPGRTWVGRLTIPANATSPTNQAGLVPFVEYGDAPFERMMSLSTQPCDFRGFTPGSPIFTTDLTGVNAAMAFSGSINPSISFLLQEDQQVFPPKPRLQPGQTYFINIRTIRALDGANSCFSASGTCNGLVTVMTPR